MQVIIVGKQRVPSMDVVIRTTLCTLFQVAVKVVVVAVRTVVVTIIVPTTMVMVDMRDIGTLT
jgi:hypothetical protein